MILFILEGNKPDRSLYKTMMTVCGVGEDTVDFVYGCNTAKSNSTRIMRIDLSPTVGSDGMF